MSEKLITRAFQRNIHIGITLFLCRDIGYRPIGAPNQAIYVGEMVKLV
jgi:hypothetical protein